MTLKDLVGADEATLKQRADAVAKSRAEAAQRARAKMDPETRDLFDALKKRFGARFHFMDIGGEEFGRRPAWDDVQWPEDNFGVSPGTPGLLHNYNPKVITETKEKYRGKGFSAPRKSTRR